jgi:type II secretory pathway pseudopilin PulG
MLGPRRPTRRSGFTLLEAMIALSVALAACGAMALSLHSAFQQTDYTVEQTIAHGLAEQLADEVLGRLYADGDAYSTFLGPSATEQAGQARERYNDADDYNGVRRQPPTDPWGVPLGTDDGEGGRRHENFMPPTGYLDRWRQEIDVYYVNASNPSVRLTGTQTSPLRAVEVRIYDVEPNGARRQLTLVRRVISHVPSP